MSRVLFLTQVLPWPLDAGPKVRAYYVLRWLAAQHEVTLLSFVRDDTRPEDVAHLRTFCPRVEVTPMRRSLWRNLRAGLGSLLTRQPAVILRDDVREMRQCIDRLTAETAFDVIHADQTSMVYYALYARDRAVAHHSGSSPALILDAHNALYRVPERLAGVERNPLIRWVLRREARLLQRYERDTYKRFDQVVFVTDVDRQLFGLQDALVIPICADPDSTPVAARVARSHTILHLGTMFWPPNVEGMLWFVNEVYPLVRAQVPDARLAIVGKNPPASITALAGSVPGIEVTGYVPDPTPWLQDCAAFIVPLRAAGGMRVKIVDAWCWGLPIVSTTIGAEGIDVLPGENLLLADTASDFADAVVSLLRDPTRGAELAANGRRWVEQRYGWRTVYQAWEQVYAQTTVNADARGNLRND